MVLQFKVVIASNFAVETVLQLFNPLQSHDSKMYKPLHANWVSRLHSNMLYFKGKKIVNMILFKNISILVVQSSKTNGRRKGRTCTRHQLVLQAEKEDSHKNE